MYGTYALLFVLMPTLAPRTIMNRLILFSSIFFSHFPIQRCWTFLFGHFACFICMAFPTERDIILRNDNDDCHIVAIVFSFLIVKSAVRPDVACHLIGLSRMYAWYARQPACVQLEPSNRDSFIKLITCHQSP